MYVCLCKGVTDHQIRASVSQGASTFREVRDALGVATQCGKCACLARDIIKRETKPEPSALSALFYSAI